MASGFTWFRLDTDIASNPKIVDLITEYGARGKAAAFVWIASIGHCSQHLTDGHVKKGVLPLLHGTPADARLLVEAGMWAVAEKGWEIVNYAEHQPTRDVAEAMAKRRSEAGRAGAMARWHGASS